MAYSPQISPNTQEGRAFLQRRARRFLLTVGGIGAGFLVWRLTEMARLGEWWWLTHASFLWHVAATAILLTGAGVLRFGEPSLLVIRVIEISTIVVGSAAYMAMGMYIPELGRPEYVLLLIMTITLVARAVWVPSHARHTLMLGVGIGIPFLATTYAYYLGIDPSRYEAIDPEFSRLSAATVARSMVVGVGTWWLAVLLLSTLATRVIYGLRRQADRAKQLGQYTLVEKLGEGGMGVVYRAKHAMLRRPTAVKLLHPDKAGHAALERFEKEVQLTAKLTHANTVTIFDYGRTPDGVFYYAMELLDGPSLQDVVSIDGPLPPGRVLHLIAQAAGALAEAHSVGLIHRDIKPANIMVVQQGGVHDVVKVVDFGLVKELEQDVSVSLTAANAVTGTPQYMSPESITSPEKVDGRSDLYALGAVAYYLLAGDHVFRGSSVVEVCSHHLHTEPGPIAELRGEDVPEAIEALVRECLQKDPAARPQTAGELRRRLLDLAEAHPWSEDDARAWWEHYEAETHRWDRPQSSASGPRTFSVDLVRRPSSGDGNAGA
jgi:serine/threonine-protein kinase